MKIILEAVVGSQAYGLATQTSDIDKLGLFVVPTKDILSTGSVKQTIVHNEPDITIHEVGKFCTLALKCNPTILELLYLNEYETITPEGEMLIKIRDSFLSNTVKFSYGGYALQQARKLSKRGHSFSSKTKNRYPKHARHCFRLLQQGRQLLEEGTLDVRVTPKIREMLFQIGEMEPQELITTFEREFESFNQIESVLPDAPNYNIVDKTLIKIRRMNW